jgi:hypothetical protein
VECGRLVYREEGQTKAVLFDVHKDSCVENQKEIKKDWVITRAIACLSHKTRAVSVLIGAGLLSSPARKRRQLVLVCPCFSGGLF